MLLARAAAVGGKLASRHEAALLKRIRNLIVASTPNESDLRNIGQLLLQASYRDIVTLNFDRTIDQALSIAKNMKSSEKYNPSGKEKSFARKNLRFEIGNLRIWHPHGVASPRIPP
jgi:hypothetical protein